MLLVFEYTGDEANHSGRISSVPTTGLSGETAPELAIPAGVAILNERPSFAQVKRGGRTRMFVSGGADTDLEITDTGAVLRQFIRPPLGKLVVDSTPDEGTIGLEVVAGTGPTGLCIFYLRWWDPANDRRSPLSAPSPTVTLDGSHSVKFRGIPSGPNPADTGVRKLEVWVSRNGAAIRKLATRDIGASTITVSETIEYQAETVENLQERPRCRFNAIYHERQFTSGDPLHPERVYFSPLDRPSDYAGGYLSTRDGSAVVGLAVIRDVLVVFSAKATHYVAGYSEDDLEMRVLEPAIGAITHHGIKLANDIGFVPSHQGLYACTGTSMEFLAGDYTDMWAEMYSENPLAFELGFGVVDERAKVYKFFMEDVTVEDGVPSFGTGRYWVFDYRSFSRQDGGGYAAPMLSFDTHAARPRCATMLADPGGRAGDCYTAFTGIETGTPNRVVKENQWKVLDRVGARTTVIQPAVVGYEPDGGPNDGITAVEGWLLVSLISKVSWLLEMVHGPAAAAVRNGFSWSLSSMFGIPQGAAPADGGGREITPDWASSAANTFTPAALPFKMGITGEGVGIRLSVVDAIGLIWSGWGMTVAEGKKFLAKKAV